MNKFINRGVFGGAVCRHVLNGRSLPVVAGMLSLAMAVPSQAREETYGDAMKAIQSQLRANQMSAAEAALLRLDRRFPRNPEVTAMRMRLACQRKDFEAAGAFKSQLGMANSANADLRDATAFCATEQQLAQAEKYLTQGAAAQAISILLPLAQQEKAGYRAGRMLATAYLANNQPNEAEALFTQLAARYPADATDLLRQAERLQNDRALIAPQASFAAGDLPATIAASKSLFDAARASGRDSYNSGILLARAYTDDRQFDAAASVYTTLAKQYPNDQDLAQLARQASELHSLSTAKSLLDRGDNAAAVAYLTPIYPTLADRYQAGLLLIQAHRALGNKTKVAELTATLAHDYPADTSLPPAVVTTALADAQYTVAADRYAGLTPEQRVQVLTELGGNGDRLSRRSITLFGAVGSSDANRGEDALGGIRLKLASQIGTITASAARVQRFNQYANEFGLGFSTSLGRNTSADVGYTHSTGAGFLARQSITLALSHSLATLDLYGSVRHLIYPTTVADVLYAGIGKQLSATTSMRAGVFYVPQSNAYSVLGGVDLIDANGDKTFATITAGRAGEQTGFRDSVLRSASYSLLLGRLLNFSNQTSLLGSVNYEHRAGLFNRLGMNLELTKGW